MSIKRKILSIISIICLAVALLAVGVWAVTETNFKVSGDIEYGVSVLPDSQIPTEADYSYLTFEFSDEITPATTDPLTASVVGFDKSVTSVEIPESIKHNEKVYTVTSIGNEVFKDCTGITSVTMGNGVTSIGESAFRACGGLTGPLVIPNSVISIGADAFMNCSKLTGQLVIPNSVISIGEYAFYYCSGLTSVTILGSGVTSIGDDAFSHCSGLTSVTIGSGVTSIGSYAFDSCSGLIGQLVIPNSVTSIGDHAFAGCSGLTSIEIPNSVTNIEELTFYGCHGLTSIEIPNSVTSIGYMAFFYCSGLTSVIIGSGVTSIEEDVFMHCSGLKSVFLTSYTTIPSIPDYTPFKNCPSDMTFYVQSALYSKYKATSPFNSYPIFSMDSNYKSSEADSVLWNFSGRNYKKSKGGVAYIASLNRFNNASETWANPLLVSKTAEAAQYDFEYQGWNNVTALPFTYNGETWYVSNTSGSMPGRLDSQIKNNVPKLDMSVYANDDLVVFASRLLEYVAYLHRTTVHVREVEEISFVGDDEYSVNTVVDSTVSELVIPDLVQDGNGIHKVTNINASALSNCTGLKSIFIPSSEFVNADSGTFDACPSDLTIYVPIELYAQYNNTAPYSSYTIFGMDSQYKTSTEESVLWKWCGRSYRKSDAGESFIATAQWHSPEGKYYTSPLLVSKTSAGACFDALLDPNVDSWSPVKSIQFSYKGETWYVCHLSYAMEGLYTNEFAYNIPVLDFTNLQSSDASIAAKCLIDYVYYAG